MNNKFLLLCKRGNLKKVKKMLDKYCEDKMVLDCNEGLFQAAAGGHVNVVTYLVENIEGICYQSGLDAACKYGHEELVGGFLGIDYNYNYDCAFSAACEGNRRKIMVHMALQGARKCYHCNTWVDNHFDGFADYCKYALK
jgi:hypothetical protein